jgi:hypothetical protein
MYTFSYYFQHYWLPFVLIVGLVAAGMLVYTNWDRIMIKGSGRK